MQGNGADLNGNGDDMGMAMKLEGMSYYKNNMDQILLELHKKDIRLDRIDRHIPCILEQYATSIRQ